MFNVFFVGFQEQNQLICEDALIERSHTGLCVGCFHENEDEKPLPTRSSLFFLPSLMCPLSSVLSY